MCVNPNIAVGTGANMAGDLVALHCQLHKHPLPLHPVLFWHAIVSCCVSIHLTIACRHHARMGQTTGTRQLQGGWVGG